MAKKFGKFLAFSMFVGAAAAGTYYYLKNKQEDPLDDMDDFDDFDDFNEDLDDDLDDHTSSSSKNRTYVSLDFENAKEVISEKVIETIDKAKEKIEEFNVSEKLDKAKEKIEEFAGTEPVTSYTDVTPQTEDETEDNVTAASYSEPPVMETPVQDPTPATEESFSKVEEFFNDSEDE